MGLPDSSVWMDAQGCQNPHHFERGIARQVAESTRSIAEAVPEAIHTIGLNHRLPLPISLDYLHGTGLLGWVGEGAQGGPPTPPEIYHVTSPFETIELDQLWPLWARGQSVKTVVTLHDLIPLIFPEHYLEPNRSYHAPYLARVGLVRAADHILAVSEHTAADAVEHLEFDEDRITVIDAGVSPQMASMVESREEASKILRDRIPGLRDHFVLYVGGDDWRKNMEGTIRAYSLFPDGLRQEFQLVITCKLSPDRHVELLGFAASQGIREGQLLLTGFVTDRELAALYRRCDLFVFPSLYEGAGLPVIEAMSCGAPVIGANKASVPEILGDLRASFDPADPADIAACMERTLTNPGELERLREVSAARARVLTWDHVAGKAVEGYERALGGHSRGSQRAARKRLAIFTSWSADEPEIADHSRRLAEALSAYAEVDLIVAGDHLDLADEADSDGMRFFAAEDFDWAHGLRGYDRILYVLANSPSFRPVFEALLRRPGVVEAHDVHFNEIYEDLARNQSKDEPLWLWSKLWEMYRQRISSSDLRLSRTDPAVTERFGIFMSAEVQRHAQKLLVHSRYAADILRMDRQPDEPGAATVVVGAGLPEPARHGANGTRPSATPTILAIEPGDPESIDLVLHAFSRISQTKPATSLGVVGRLDEETRVRLGETVSNLGISGEVRVLGDTSDDGFTTALRDAAVVVQVTGTSRGAASARLCECIAAGVPAVVSSSGWLGELPDPVALKIPMGCRPASLAELIAEVLDDEDLRRRIQSAQRDYAIANSHSRVAAHYAELLEL